MQDDPSSFIFQGMFTLLTFSYSSFSFVKDNAPNPPEIIRIALADRAYELMKSKAYFSLWGGVLQHTSQ